MELNEVLQELDLTAHESTIYLTLRRLGESTTGPIIKTTKIHASKVYENLYRLAEKGLVSTSSINNTKHFQAVEPQRLFDLLADKEKKLLKQKELLEKNLPRLEKLNTSKNVNVQVYQGWKGMESIYAHLRRVLQESKGTNHIFGASTGTHKTKTQNFFNKHLREMARLKIKEKIIYNEEARGYLSEHEKNKKLFQGKYLSHSTPTEVNIFEDNTLIILLKDEPLVIHIQDEETARSFKSYFDVLWKLAKE